MKRQLLCLLVLFGTAFCFARGKQEVIVSENFSTESKNVVVTIVNKSEADFQTLVITRKEALPDKWDLTDRRTFSVRSGESKSVVLDNQGLYKLELYDGKGHKFSKKNTYSQVIKDKSGNVISEGEFQQFTQPWQKLVFTEQDFEPQATIDILEVFFGIHGNEKHDAPPVKNCSVIVVNNTGEQIDYVSVLQNGKPRSSNLSMGRGQCGVLDIPQSETADISLVSRNQHVFTKADLVFDAENLMLVFTAGDREKDAEKASGFVTSVLSSISSALSITTQVFSTMLGQSDEFEEASPAADDAVEITVSSADAEPLPETETQQEPGFWSWLPWVD